jgi:hypothetical protein
MRDVLHDTQILKRWPAWVCERCYSPIKLIKQTSKCHDDYEECKWCKTKRTVRTTQWRKYPDNIDIFFGRI